MRAWFFPILIASALALAGWNLGRGLAAPRVCEEGETAEEAVVVALPSAVEVPLSLAEFRDGPVMKLVRAGPGGLQTCSNLVDR